ncbi:hypothetical protein cypCar_00020904, partial [Cyprinus carpio]
LFFEKRYPIHDPREACYGDKYQFPGVRTYGVRDVKETYDVYCFAEKMTGKVFHTTSPNKFTFEEAEAECAKLAAKLATTGQLYLAWKGGMDVCNAGWLADRSVRYPINIPRPQCGGGLLGVRTVYLFPNQTGYPLSDSRYDAFCYSETAEEGSGLLPFDIETTTEAGSGVLSVDTITESPQLFLKPTSTESELKGEVVTYKPSVTTSVEFPYTALNISQLPLSPIPSSAEVVTDIMEGVIDRTDVGSDLSRLNETEAIKPATEGTTPTTIPAEPSGPDASGASGTDDLLSSGSGDHLGGSVVSIGDSSGASGSGDLPSGSGGSSGYGSGLDIQVTFSGSDFVLSEVGSPSGRPKEAAEAGTEILTFPFGQGSGHSGLDTSGLGSGSGSGYSFEESGSTSDFSSSSGESDESGDLSGISSGSGSSEESSGFSGFPSGIFPSRGSSGISFIDGSGVMVDSPWLKVSTAPHLIEQELGGSHLDLSRSGHISESGMSGDISGMSGDISGMSGDISGMSGDISGMSGDISGRSGDISGMSGDISGMNGDISGMSGARSGISGDISGMSGDISGMSGDIYGVSDDISGFCDVHSGSGSGLEFSGMTFLGSDFIDLEEQTREQEASGLLLFGSGKGSGFTSAGYGTESGERLGESANGEIIFTNNGMVEMSNKPFQGMEQGSGEVEYSGTVRLSSGSGDDQSAYSSGQEQEWIPFTEDMPTVNSSDAPLAVLSAQGPSGLNSNAAGPPVPYSEPEGITSKLETVTSAALSSSTEPTSLQSPSVTEGLVGNASLNPCEPNPCGAGVCSLKDGVGICHCPPRLHGEKCKFEVDVCHSNPCSSGATCVEVEDAFKCLCLPSYEGDRCEIVVKMPCDVASDVHSCEEGWTKFEGNCYLHFSTRENWLDAEQRCQDLNAQLVSIITPEEQAFISSYAQDYQWIGLNDKMVENDFRWSDGTSLQYENWRPNQPDNYFNSEDCVVMIGHGNGQWNDMPCNYYLPFTCKTGPVTCAQPPKVENARMFGNKKEHYQVNSVIRYQCSENFIQRHLPVIRCMADGQWEKPQVRCIAKVKSGIQKESSDHHSHKSITTTLEKHL